jgi:hypothetical protein
LGQTTCGGWRRRSRHTSARSSADLRGAAPPRHTEMSAVCSDWGGARWEHGREADAASALACRRPVHQARLIR